LVVTAPRRAWWMLRYTLGGRTREMGLGAADPEGRDGRTLVEARERAAEERKLLRAGIDPLARREEKARAAQDQAARRNFREAAEALIAEKSAEWRNPKHRAQWASTLATYAYPVLGAMASRRSASRR
jgi:Arm DNA-binding domain